MILQDLTTSRLEVDEESAIWQLDDSLGFWETSGLEVDEESAIWQLDDSSEFDNF